MARWIGEFLKDRGMRFTFIRERAYKHFRNLNTLGHFESHEDDWQVLGFHDFLHVIEFSTLSDLANLSAVGHRNGRSPSELFVSELVPFPPEESVRQHLLDPPRVDDEGEGCLLSLYCLTFSPAIFELPNNAALGDVFRSTITRLHECLSERYAGKFAIWGCISGCDLVVTALPNGPKQLRQLHDLFLEFGRLEPSDLDAPIAEKSGHLFSISVPYLCFSRSQKAKELFQSPRFTDEEIDTAMDIEFRLRVDCGHEIAVQNDIRERMNQLGQNWMPSGRPHVAFMPPKRIDAPDEADGAVWGHFSVAGRFGHFFSLVDVWEGLWFQESRVWRRANLVDSFTSVGFPQSLAYGFAQVTSDEPPYSQAWELNEHVAKELREIEDAISGFAQNYLSEPQGHELEQLFYRFQDCLYRQDLVSVGRSVFPFFSQLAAALSEPAWETFLTPGSGEGDELTGEDLQHSLNRTGRLDDEFDRLISFLRRALRNRVEYRGQQGDPPVPHTIYHGLGKLLDAYAAVVWLASELFQRGDEVKLDIGNADSFALLQCSGFSGRIQCGEALTGFRRYLERESEDERIIPIRMLESSLVRESSQNARSWSARLYLLQISGNTLLNPIICTANCFHEIAELSAWMRMPHTIELREAANNWLISEVADHLLSVMIEDDELTNEYLDLYHPFATSFFKFLLPLTIRSQSIRYSLDMVPEDSDDELDWLIRTCHPLDFLRVLEDGIELAFSDPSSILEQFAEQPLEGDVPPFFGKIEDLGVQEDVWSRVENVRALAKESLADVGMMTAIFQLLHTRQGLILTQDMRAQFVNFVFAHAVSAAVHSRGPKHSSSRLLRIMLHRWSIQLAAVRGKRSEWDQEILRVLMASEQLKKWGGAAEKCLKMFKSDTWLFAGDAESLVDALCRRPEYAQPSFSPQLFPGLSTFNEVENELLQAFCNGLVEQVNGPDGTVHGMGYIMDLWTMSQWIGPPELLSPK